MRMKLFFGFVAMCFIMAVPNISYAKFSSSSSFSSSRSFSSSYSRPSSSFSSSYSRPKSYSSNSFSYSKPKSYSSGSSYSKPSTNYVSLSSTKTSSTHFNRQGSFAVSSSNYKSLNSYSKKYNEPPTIVNRTYYSSPSYTRVYTSYHSANGYYAARQHDISGWYSRYPAPVYVYHMHPNYGIWDSYFLYLILANASQPSYAQWAYAHQNDPSYQAWYTDMQQQAQNNAQVQQQLSTLNAQVAALKAGNAIPESQTVLPNGVSTAVAISPTAVAQDSTVQSGTGFFGWLLRIIVVGFLLFVVMWVLKSMLFTKKTTISW